MKETVRILLDLRKQYDDLEMRHAVDFAGDPIATWQGYKFFRNPISDEIEKITGVRSDEEVREWLER